MKTAVEILEKQNTQILDAYEIVRRWALKKFGQDGEDYTHEAYLELFSPNRRPRTLKLKPIEIQVQWRILVAKAKNAAVEEARGVIHMHSEKLTEEDTIATPQDKHTYVKGVLRHLPQDTKKLMYQIVIDQCSYSQVACDFGLTIPAVQRRYNKGVRQLQELLLAESQVA